MKITELKEIDVNIDDNLILVDCDKKSNSKPLKEIFDMITKEAKERGLKVELKNDRIAFIKL